MNIDKSLYMKEFLEIRNSLGCVHNLEAKHILYANLYNDFLPKEIKKKVEAVVEEIEEKTILISNKKGVLFEDLPEEPLSDAQVSVESPDADIKDLDPILDEPKIEDTKIEDTKIVDIEPIKDDVKPIDGGGDIMGGGREFKKIVINPNYVALDK
jgi:hypothetical protein